MVVVVVDVGVGVAVAGVALAVGLEGPGRDGSSWGWEVAGRGWSLLSRSRGHRGRRLWAPLELGLGLRLWIGLLG